MGVPITAHILGGCVIPANLGVNPSLAITALSEYIMSGIPYRSQRSPEWSESEPPNAEDPDSSPTS